MKITLHLKGYLTPSPNESRWSSWKVAYGEKRKAARALLSALNDEVLDFSIQTTCMVRSRASLIASAQRNLSLMMIVNRSRFLSSSQKSKPAKNTKP